jgi:alpha-glucan,water dikinase
LCACQPLRIAPSRALARCPPSSAARPRGAPAPPRPCSPSSAHRSPSLLTRSLARPLGRASPACPAGRAAPPRRAAPRAAFAPAAAERAAPPLPPGEPVYESRFALRSGAPVAVAVYEGADGSQTAVLSVDAPGRLLLHWGLDAGGGGWRLPSREGLPRGTAVHKKRALQTPFPPPAAPGAPRELRVTITPAEAADFLNFVFKDEDTGAWHDAGGGANFQAPLRAALVGTSSEEEDAEAFAAGQPPLLPPDAVPPPPAELCGVWAYMRWEAAGCPGRSQAESDAEYERATAEVRLLLRRGVGLEALRGVADAGVGLYREFAAEQARLWAPPPAARRRAPAVVDAPAEVAEAPAEEVKEEAPAPAPAARAAEAPPPLADVGESTGMGSARDPLSLIRPAAPPRLAEAPAARDAPLAPLARAAAADAACAWRRTYPLGARAELLAAVRLDDPADPVASPLTVTLTTDLPADAVLHWGVVRPNSGGRGSGGWQGPPPALVPAGSARVGGADADGAADTPFAACKLEECEVTFGGAAVPLQRAELRLPAGHGLAALCFVLRSADGTRWWKDGGGNFTVPLPGAPAAPASPVAGHPEAAADEVSRKILDWEASSSWTLMHRFNAAAEVVGGVLEGRHPDAEAAMARVFVWLRYSAIRQLTWQRHYNTQPRILGAAQERLTHALADAAARLPGGAAEWARLAMGTVGRGGNAQAVRDEILNIMHRNKVCVPGWLGGGWGKIFIFGYYYYLCALSTSQTLPYFRRRTSAPAAFHFLPLTPTPPTPTNRRSPRSRAPGWRSSTRSSTTTPRPTTCPSARRTSPSSPPTATRAPTGACSATRA